jgi:hypothetical protein
MEIPNDSEPGMAIRRDSRYSSNKSAQNFSSTTPDNSSVSLAIPFAGEAHSACVLNDGNKEQHESRFWDACFALIHIVRLLVWYRAAAAPCFICGLIFLY